MMIVLMRCLSTLGHIFKSKNMQDLKEIRIRAVLLLHQASIHLSIALIWAMPIKLDMNNTICQISMDRKKLRSRDLAVWFPNQDKVKQWKIFKNWSELKRCLKLNLESNHLQFSQQTNLYFQEHFHWKIEFRKIHLNHLLARNIMDQGHRNLQELQLTDLLKVQNASQFWNC